MADVAERNARPVSLRANEGGIYLDARLDVRVLVAGDTFHARHQCYRRDPQGDATTAEADEMSGNFDSSAPVVRALRGSVPDFLVDAHAIRLVRRWSSSAMMSFMNRTMGSQRVTGPSQYRVGNRCRTGRCLSHAATRCRKPVAQMSRPARRRDNRLPCDCANGHPTGLCIFMSLLSCASFGRDQDTPVR